MFEFGSHSTMNDQHEMDEPDVFDGPPRVTNADMPEPPRPVNWNLMTAHELEQEWLMQAHYADARAHLDDALGLLANCADIYRRCDDTNRRLCNRPSSRRSSSTRTTSCASSTTDLSRCSSIHRSTPTL